MYYFPELFSFLLYRVYSLYYNIFLQFVFIWSVGLEWRNGTEAEKPEVLEIVLKIQTVHRPGVLLS